MADPEKNKDSMVPKPADDGMVLSPYSPTKSSKRVSREQFETIKKMLGVQSLLIVCDEYSHDCKNEEDCPGHFIFFRAEGFNEGNLAGVAESLWYGAEVIADSHKNLE